MFFHYQDAVSEVDLRKRRQFKVVYHPWGISWFGDDKIVLCGNGSLVHVHAADGSDIASVAMPGSEVWDVAWHGNSLFVTEYSPQDGRVFVYDEKLDYVGTINVGYKGVQG